MPTQASPGLSVLKAHLEANGYEIEIKYWNIFFFRLQKDFFLLGNHVLTAEGSDLLKLFPFLNYLAHKSKDRATIEKIKSSILSMQPQFQSKGNRFLEHYLSECSDRVEELLDAEIAKMNVPQYLYIGLSGQFQQWVFGNILVERIKLKHPSIVVVIGGLPARETATSILRNFSAYDYALWGEGEHSLLWLTRMLDPEEGEVDIRTVPNLAYRNRQAIETTIGRNLYVNLDSQPIPDFRDYFCQLRSAHIQVPVYLPVEGSRGCHWRKCRFCFLNAGYKYRQKSPLNIVNEIKTQIREYNVHTIAFLDNDVIGMNAYRFDTLLNLLIEYRKENPKFRIKLAEVITSELNAEVVKKMWLAGFHTVQIGYESPSASILKKIDKKNTFASNLLFIKWATIYGIKIAGLNVIKNLPEETTEDIYEAINNLRFLRFSLHKGQCEHNDSLLAINKLSRYFNQIESDGRLDDWNSSLLESFFPTAYIDDRYSLLECVRLKYDTTWDSFFKIEKFYGDNPHTYSLVTDGDTIYYTEYRNGSQISQSLFGKDSLEWQILQAANDSVSTLDQIVARTNCLDKASLTSTIVDLKDSGLLYSNNTLDELVTIIDTSLVK